MTRNARGKIIDGEVWVAYGGRDVGTGDTLRRGVEVVESGGLADLGDDLGANTEG